LQSFSHRKEFLSIFAPVNPRENGLMKKARFRFIPKGELGHSLCEWE
jgi:hypothetical protein